MRAGAKCAPPNLSLNLLHNSQFPMIFLFFSLAGCKDLMEGPRHLALGEGRVTRLRCLCSSKTERAPYTHMGLGNELEIDLYCIKPLSSGSYLLLQLALPCPG